MRVLVLFFFAVLIAGVAFVYGVSWGQSLEPASTRGRDYDRWVYSVEDCNVLDDMAGYFLNQRMRGEIPYNNASVVLDVIATRQNQLHCEI